MLNVKRHVANQVNPILAYNEDVPTCGMVCVPVTVCLHCERFKLQRRENSCCCCSALTFGGQRGALKIEHGVDDSQGDGCKKSESGK